MNTVLNQTELANVAPEARHLLRGLLMAFSQKLLARLFLPHICVPTAALLTVLLCAPASVAQAGCVGGSPNGIEESGEACDDGNFLGSDDCKNECTANV